MPEPYIVGYNSVISGLVHHGFYKESMCFFTTMHKMGSGFGLFLDEYTISSAVSSCAVLGANVQLSCCISFIAWRLCMDLSLMLIYAIH